MAIFGKKSAVAKTISKPKSLTYNLRSGSVLVPVTSEKATRLQQVGQYMFSVMGRVNKVEAKKAIESRYGVRVLGVNSLGLPGKVVRRGRSSGSRKARRHLIIRLARGETIDLNKSV